ncbi:MAG: 1-deoxy-D-xylulose-5-phosphate reductoisomerase [Candidatus Aureabacteria bacterium]|nr:1-deoxy-D-xylulose-5-phosphate reductoisomerase [Candidatus Auribacterota bacterium]
MKKRIAVLGSTGSIGRSTLDVVRHQKDLFEVFALTAHTNSDMLLNQINEFHPKVAVLTSDMAAEEVRKKAPPNVKVLYGEACLEEVASAKSVDFVMAAMVGSSGLLPFLAALESKKQIGLANKEVLVMAGEYLHSKYPGFLKQIMPVDSEHCAIFQCLLSGRKDEVESLILTASGGPFRKRKNLKSLTVKEALKHPNWQMGRKITIDSSTLMNKGFEVMEARWLFSVALNQIKVLIHPQSIIHSMVCFQDGSVVAQMGVTDMRLPIQYALSYPRRLANSFPRLELSKIKSLTFENLDRNRFPCLQFAFTALEKGGTYPAALNAANEIAVSNFLEGNISYWDIVECNRYILGHHQMEGPFGLDSIMRADKKARHKAQEWIAKRFTRKK